MIELSDSIRELARSVKPSYRQDDGLIDTVLVTYWAISEMIEADAQPFIMNGFQGRIWHGSFNAVISELWPELKRPEGASADTTWAATIKRCVNNYCRTASVILCRKRGATTTWWVRDNWEPRLPVSAAIAQARQEAAPALDTEQLLVDVEDAPAAAEEILVDIEVPAAQQEMADWERDLLDGKIGKTPSVPAPSRLVLPESQRILIGRAADSLGLVPVETETVTFFADIDPMKAAFFLEKNACMRNMSPQTITMYALDMKEGRWYLTHQGLAFDPDGWLTDGQQRMMAVIESGCTIRFAITIDLPRDGFSAYDVGRVRLLGDQLGAEFSARNRRDLGTIARRAWLWEAGFPYNPTVKPSVPAIKAMLLKPEYKDLFAAAEFAEHWRTRRVLVPAQAGFCWWVLQRLDAAAAHEYMGQLASGDFGEVPPDALKRYPPYVLREQLAAMPGSKRDTWIKMSVIIARVFIGYNHWKNVKPQSKIQLPQGQLSNTHFPRPDEKPRTKSWAK